MGYYEICSKYKNFEWEQIFGAISEDDVEKAIASEDVGVKGFMALLSPAAQTLLEKAARRSHEITLRNFGRTIQLYTPMYLSNYCDNSCVYCGFNTNNKIERRALTLKEVREEAGSIASTGLKTILILTGESRQMSPISYIKDCVRVLKEYFSSISIEIYPLTETEYSLLVSTGVDGLTIYQEVYEEDIYNRMHPSGPKSGYRFRLDAPERGAKSGMRSVNIGALFGLGGWRKEAFLLGLHAKYLQDKFHDTEIGVSIPRIRRQALYHVGTGQAGGFKAPYAVSDKNIVQIIVSLRLFLPRIGITVSTREDASFRESLVPLGVTKMSAGSTTRVGGRIVAREEREGAEQFEILDKRSVEEIKRMLESKDYQPVLKDWTCLR